MSDPEKCDCAQCKKHGAETDLFDELRPALAKRMAVYNKDVQLNVLASLVAGTLLDNHVHPGEFVLVLQRYYQATAEGKAADSAEHVMAGIIGPRTQA